ncbi:MAG: hypothetical protein WCY10_06565 [Candidatus Omnitrophota bacterium]
MNILALKGHRFSPAILATLSERGLIRPLKPASNVVKCRDPRGTVGAIYTSKACYGGHKLISVRCTTGPVRLNFHADNEEFILIDPRAGRFSPLYMIVGLHKHEIIERKARNGTLVPSDFLALELVYNDPRLSVFTMLKGTPHFEIAGRSRKEAPVFFVTEPSRLKLHIVDLAGYRLVV